MLLIAGIFLLSGCATTSIQAVKHPNAPSRPYGTILVFIDEDYQAKVKYEDYLVKKFKGVSNTNVISHHSLFNPLKKYPLNEVLKILKENKIEAVLMGQRGELTSYSSTFFMPTFQTTTGSASGYVGNQFVNLSTRSTSTGTQAIPYTTYSLKYLVNLMDVKTKKPIWFSSSETVGDGGFVESLSSAVIKELGKSGLIVMKVPSKRRR